MANQDPNGQMGQADAYEQFFNSVIDTSQRRPQMVSIIRDVIPEADFFLQEKFAASTEQVCEQLWANNCVDYPACDFEYWVDYTVWNSFFQPYIDLGVAVQSWPWAGIQPPFYRGESSATYRGWVMSRGREAPYSATPIVPDVPTAAPPQSQSFQAADAGLAAAVPGALAGPHSSAALLGPANGLAGGSFAPTGGYPALNSDHLAPAGSYPAPAGGPFAPTGHPGPAGGHPAPAGDSLAPTGGYPGPAGDHTAPAGGYYAPVGAHSAADALATASLLAIGGIRMSIITSSAGRHRRNRRSGGSAAPRRSQAARQDAEKGQDEQGVKDE